MKQKSSALRAKEAFLSLYQAGEFAPGSKIPSEVHMAERLGVSRETWRKTWTCCEATDCWSPSTDRAPTFWKNRAALPTIWRSCKA